MLPDKVVGMMDGGGWVFVRVEKEVAMLLERAPRLRVDRAMERGGREEGTLTGVLVAATEVLWVFMMVA